MAALVLDVPIPAPVLTGDTLVNNDRPMDASPVVNLPPPPPSLATLTPNDIKVNGNNAPESAPQSATHSRCNSEDMVTSHLSKSKEQQDVMSKFFGVSLEQMKRAQALLRLGVTEDDLKVAEKLFRELPPNAELSSKEERILGASRSQISFFKALEVLGVDMRSVEEDHAKRLGSIGELSLTTPPGSPMASFIPFLSPPNQEVRKLKERITAQAATIKEQEIEIKQLRESLAVYEQQKA